MDGLSSVYDAIRYVVDGGHVDVSMSRVRLCCHKRDGSTVWIVVVGVSWLSNGEPAMSCIAFKGVVTWLAKASVRCLSI
jgi:hypothetical protein